mmetsp:Transcript_147564/g.474076  ORF Transcript_147564/g.474076 Transcript_147564/m.474076 type:complete len:433 (-) Transcript_147564:50-1348(-)
MPVVNCPMPDPTSEGFLPLHVGGGGADDGPPTQRSRPRARGRAAASAIGVSALATLGLLVLAASSPGRGRGIATGAEGSEVAQGLFGFPSFGGPKPRYCGSGGRSAPGLAGLAAVDFSGALLPSPPFTIVARIRALSKAGDPEAVLAWGAQGGQGDCLRVGLGSGGALEYWESNRNVVNHSDVSLRDSTWNTIAVVREASGSVSLYADGILLGNAHTSEEFPSRCSFTARSSSATADAATFDGDIGTLRVYSSALTLAQLDFGQGPCYASSPSATAMLRTTLTTTAASTTPRTTTTAPTTTTATTTPRTTTTASTTTATTTPRTTTAAPTTTTVTTTPLPTVPPVPPTTTTWFTVTWPPTTTITAAPTTVAQPWLQWLAPAGQPAAAATPAPALPVVPQARCFPKSSLDNICEGLPESNCLILSNCEWRSTS